MNQRHWSLLCPHLTNKPNVTQYQLRKYGRGILQYFRRESCILRHCTRSHQRHQEGETARKLPRRWPASATGKLLSKNWSLKCRLVVQIGQHLITNFDHYDMHPTEVERLVKEAFCDRRYSWARLDGGHWFDHRSCYEGTCNSFGQKGLILGCLNCKRSKCTEQNIGWIWALLFDLIVQRHFQGLSYTSHYLPIP